MKKMLLTMVFAALGAFMLLAAAGDKEKRRALAGKVYGRICIVSSGGDVLVRVVHSFPDLKVQIVNAFADSPGKWQLVDGGWDYRVQFVSSGEHMTVQFVNAFPGVGN